MLNNIYAPKNLHLVVIYDIIFLYDTSLHKFHSVFGKLEDVQYGK